MWISLSVALLFIAAIHAMAQTPDSATLTETEVERRIDSILGQMTRMKRAAFQ